jgi:hypothetical protein
MRLTGPAFVQLRASNNEYFTAPDFFASALVNRFEDAAAEWKFATYATDFELIDDSSSVRMYLVPLTAGTYDLASGEVPAAKLNGAKIRIVAATGDLTPAGQVAATDLNAVACGRMLGIADVSASNSTVATTSVAASGARPAAAVAAAAWAPALVAVVVLVLAAV